LKDLKLNGIVLKLELELLKKQKKIKKLKKKKLKKIIKKNKKVKILKKKKILMMMLMMNFDFYFIFKNFLIENFKLFNKHF
jgi:hypothetical protein